MRKELNPRALRLYADSAAKLLTHYIKLALKEAGSRIDGDVEREIAAIIKPVLYPMIDAMEEQQQDIVDLQTALGLLATAVKNHNGTLADQAHDIDMLQEARGNLSDACDALKRGHRATTGTLESMGEALGKLDRRIDYHATEGEQRDIGMEDLRLSIEALEEKLEGGECQCRKRSKR